MPNFFPNPATNPEVLTHLTVTGTATFATPQIVAGQTGNDYSEIDVLANTAGRGAFLGYDTVGYVGTLDASLLQINTNGTVGQVQISHVASANRMVTLAGSNGANPAISVTGGGELAVGTHAWTFGAANAVSPTSPDRTLTVTVGGSTYYIAAKTTNN